MSDAPEPEAPGGGGRFALPRWSLLVIIPGVAGPVLILAFILRTEMAFDEEHCPYQDGELRQLAPGVAVREQLRRCLPDVEERRYVIERGGARKVLGRRRFAADAFGPGYGFDGGVSDAGEVQIRVHNPGHADQPFREGTAEDAEKWGQAPPHEVLKTGW